MMIKTQPKTKRILMKVNGGILETSGNFPHPQPLFRREGGEET